MDFGISFLVFVLGLIIGSFLNVLIYRLPRGLPFVKGRSFCPKCRKKIAWFDNIPLLSFVLLKGKCRWCKSDISLRYPLVELLTGVLFLISYLSHLSFLSYLLFSGLVVVFFVDLEHQIIPDEIVIPLIVLFSLYRLFPLLTSPPRPLISEMGEAGRFLPFIAAAGSFVLFYSVYALTKNKGMGFGDVKLAFLMGLVLGWPKTAVAFYLAFLTGAIFGVILILLGKAKLRQKIAFGPFLSFSTIAVFLWGEKIIKLVFRW